MAIPPALRTLIDQLNQELAQTAQETTEGINRVRQLLSPFPNNALLIQFFAYLNTVTIFVETSRRRTQNIMEDLSKDEVTAEEIQEAGEALATSLGQALETKIEVRQIISRLRRLS